MEGGGRGGLEMDEGVGVEEMGGSACCVIHLFVGQVCANYPLSGVGCVNLCRHGDHMSMVIT